MSAIQSNRPEKNAKNRVTLTRKFQWKSCPTTHWYFLQNKFTILERFFPPKGSLVSAPQKKKKWERKAKRSGEERKKKVKDERAAKLSPKKNDLEIFLSAHARTLKAVIWHQEQKLVQCSTCKQHFGQFGFFLARQRPKNGLTRFKRHFLAKCPGVLSIKQPHLPIKCQIR